MTTTDNRPRPYSTLRGGQIIWVYPNEAQPVNSRGRSRLESDAEVRARLRAGWGYTTYWDPMPDLRYIFGKELDKLLKSRALPERQWFVE